MKITGKYKVDQNFISIYTNNAVYDIARKTREWGCLKVGERAACGIIYDQETHERYMNECTKEGTFDLEKGEFV